MATRSVAKDFYKLQKNIKSFSNGEARVVSFDDEITKFEVELNIKDGFYKDGIFNFEILLNENYPKQAPEVRFKSEIYHPNIGDGYDISAVCLNLLSEDWKENDLEDVVQGMLFLLKNPELDDALNPLFDYVDYCDETTMEKFSELVRLSLEGGDVDGMLFKRNPGLVQKDETVRTAKLESAENASKISQKTPGPILTTIDSNEWAICQGPNNEGTFILPKLDVKISSEDMLSYGLFWVYNNFVSISNNGKDISRSSCPTRLARFAVALFGQRRNSKHILNPFSTKWRTQSKGFCFVNSFCKRKFMLCN